MQQAVKDQEQIKDKISVMHKVNYASSLFSLLFFPFCLFVLHIDQIIPYIFLGFGIVTLINTLAFKTHKNLLATYHITSITALAAAVGVCLYSGGINSPFIFVLALIVFAAYAANVRYGKMYLILAVVMICGLYALVDSNIGITNVVPEASRSMYALFSILFSLLLLGGVFGSSLSKIQHRLYTSKYEIEKKNTEKNMLLKEIHHRVKNNLQTVSSLLSLQSRTISDEQMKKLIKSSQNRVIAMSIIHEMLYQRDGLSRIEYKTYVEQLSGHLVKSLKGPSNKIKLNIDIENISLGIDTAIPLGLLINEALTNALKYGIKDDCEGEIHIEIKKEDERDYVLNIGDNGCGFSDKINFSNTKSLGLKLIHNLTRQLKGSITKDPSLKGTNYIVKFKEIGEHFHSVA